MIHPVWLDSTEVEAMHLELLSEYGGLPGIRDVNLLESALARARNLLAYGKASLGELAASYGFGIARNHPFVDGNKRTALAALAVFLDLNGFEFTASEEDAVLVILRLAAGEIDEAALGSWIEANSRPAGK